ncbi:MAG: type II toxin-antitoxin system CcdA family antitoxin [Steroidobacteraceae bacterium]|nr:type II toxin-antitoxin system CcdA family antitoxin [Steroidobacteraceae bacterium]MCW5572033.1 type II toxin-antitoxin system CcdA family antitoxin [Steroidobacteraceae bacterium]
MRAAYDHKARKRPVNLTLNEDLVARARGVTENLSGVVESLLADFLARETEQRAAEARAAMEAAIAWNRFADKHGSFADEFSTL